VLLKKAFNAMKRIKISLIAAAFVLGISAAFATSGKALLDQCPNNVIQDQ